MNTEFETGRRGGKSASIEWYTPPSIIEALGGKFDLDPCAPKHEWYTAEKCYTKEDNGLVQPWEGEVFLNPPYSNPDVGHFMKRMKEHRNGIALLFARTGNKIFHEYVWNGATSIFFLRKRIKFLNDAMKSVGSPGADSCLIAYGLRSDIRLKNLIYEGKYIKLRE